MIDILMPAASPTMEEGTIAKWLVSVGDPVKTGDVIAEIETDKATLEVEAVDDGVLDVILVPAGAEAVKVNAPIGRLRGAGPAEGGQRPPPVQPDPASPTKHLSHAVRSIVTEAAPETSVIRGSECDEPLTKGEGLAASEAGTSKKAAHASPLAQRMAKARGLDLSTMSGSGPDGLITKADLDAATGQTTPASPTPGIASVAPSEPTQASLAMMGIAHGSYDLIPLDGMRKTIARRMSDSFRDIPHFPVTIDLEIDALLAVRAQLNGTLASQGTRLSVNDLIIAAAARSLRRVPEANASYTPHGIALHHHADIAVAVAVDGGLITPVLRAAETKGLAAISADMKDLAERARSKKLKPEEVQGGSFSVSNLGMFGIRSFNSIINPPHGAILSVGAGEQRGVVRDGGLVIATAMTVTLTCDHRALDGTVAARFLGVFKGLVEQPVMLLA